MNRNDVLLDCLNFPTKKPDLQIKHKNVDLQLNKIKLKAVFDTTFFFEMLVSTT